jgi:hypothetical protein
MSLNSLANAAIARRTDFEPAGRAPGTYAEIASAAAATNTALPAAVPANANAPAPPAATSVDTTMNVLTGYIPAEILTGYVAVLAALSDSIKVEWIAFWIFIVATPIVLWIVYATKAKGAGKGLPLSYSSWPLWEMAASTIAFFAWAFALPNNPFYIAYHTTWYSSSIAALVVLVASSALGLLAPLFGSRQLGP